MEKRTCKTYTIEGVDGIKIKIGTTEKNNTKVVYTTAKTKIRYTGEDNPLETYTTAIKSFNRYLDDEVRKCDNFSGSPIMGPEISENNLLTKGYTKLEYELFVKIANPAPIDKVLKDIGPFIKTVFSKLADVLTENSFIV